MDFDKGAMISAAGLRVQALRMRVIAENIANQDSVASGPGDQPYQRKVVTFKNVLNRELGIHMVKIDTVTRDNSPFGRKFDPGHPAADGDGYLTVTNVKGLIEMMDMREAGRTYSANLNAITASKNMMLQLVDLLR